MATRRRMTREEKDYFLKQVERKGKAKDLKEKDEAAFKKWEGEYQKIVQYLRENILWFFVSDIVRNDRYMDFKLLHEFLEEEEHGMVEIAKDEINKGNVPDLCLIMFMMHAKYMAMWKAAKG